MSDLKFVTGHAAALKNLYDDIGRSNYVCYDIPSLPASRLSEFFPRHYLDKCSSITIAISGGANNQDWLGMIPFRVDAQKNGAKVYDQDPFIISFDADNGKPAETGILAYHQNYDGRTSPISGYDTISKPETVAALRQQVTTGKYPSRGPAHEVITAYST